MIFVTCFMHVCLTIKYYKITGGDKIVLLDGAGANGGGAATNGLLSMIPGMFANLIGGNKMDPNLVAALMNGRNNQDGFGGANGWWLWIIVLFWLWGGKGYEGKPLCSECAAIEYSKGDEVVVVPGTWHGKFKKEWPTEEEKKHIGKNGILNM